MLDNSQLYTLQVRKIPSGWVIDHINHLGDSDQLLGVYVSRLYAQRAVVQLHAIRASTSAQRLDSQSPGLLSVLA